MKDAYYFSHDSNATNDPKIMILIAKWGLEAYGIFWTIIEHLRDQPGYKSHLSILRALALRYGSTEEKYQYVVRDFDLFVIQNDNFFYSRSLIKRMKPLEKNREQKRLAGIQSGKARNLKKLQANGCSTAVEQKGNENEQSKVKESKVKENKEIILSNIDFLYSLYPTKCLINGSSTGKGKKDKEKLDKLLKKQNKESIEKAIKWYIDDCIKHNRFMKNFSTFLNNIPDIPEENEIIEKEFFVYYQDGQLPREVPIEEMEKYKTILGPQITHSEIIKKKIAK